MEGSVAALLVYIRMYAYIVPDLVTLVVSALGYEPGSIQVRFVTFVYNLYQ